LWGKTIGITGLGEVGSRVAKRLKPFEVELVGYDPYAPSSRFEELEVKPLDIETLFKNSDIVTIHVPVTKETKGMIGEKELNLMKPSAYLINTSRAIAVDSGAL
jgi:D-3-phosphoglycerate dehydrogenase